MKRYERWLGCLLLVCFSVVANARADMRLLKARYLGCAKGRDVYLVKALGKSELPAEVRLTARSDPVSRAVFEKLAQSWLFRPDLGEVGIQHDATLMLTLVCEDLPESDGEPMAVALRSVQLELPFIIRVENMEDENYLAGSYLVDDAAALFSGSLTERECAQVSTVDRKRLGELEARAKSGAQSELVLYEQATMQRAAMIRNRAEGRKVKPSKLHQQVEELRIQLGRLEQPAGGCKVGELRAYASGFGFEVEVPSLAAIGTQECDRVMLFSLVRAMDRGEWQRHRSESEKSVSESEAVREQFSKLPADVRSGTRKPTAEEQQIFGLRRDLMKRLRDTYGVPMARYKNLGLMIIPPLRQNADSPTLSVASVEAMSNFYRKLSGIVEFYDLEDVVRTIRTTSGEGNGVGK